MTEDVAAIEEMVKEASARPKEDLNAFVEELAALHIADEEVRGQVVSVFTRVIPVAAPDDLSDLLRVMNVSLADAEQEIEEGSVNIMTMHQAKGLSADAVFIAAAEDEYVPGRAAGAAVDDERRLLYVSLTRARHFLYVTHSRRRTGAQAHTGSNPGTQRRTLTSFLSGGPIPSASGRDFVDSLPT